MILKPPLITLPRTGHPLSRGQVGCWLFNECGGNIVADLSGNGNKGTLDSTLEWQAGKFGGAIEFDPGTVEVITTDKPAKTNPYITFVAWVYPRGASDGDYGGIFWDQVTGSTSRILIGDDGQLGANIITTGITYSEFSTGDIVPMNQWSQVAFTWDGTTGKHYVNDKLEYSKVEGSGTVWPASSGLIIGKGSSADAFRFDGLISHIYLYDRALSAAEIAKLYREPFCMFRRDPIELWTAATSGGAPPSQTVLDYERKTRGVARGVIRGAA